MLLSEEFKICINLLQFNTKELFFLIFNFNFQFYFLTLKMCGFSSYFHFDNQEHTYSDLDLDGSLQQIHHRGPDSQEKFISPDHRCGKNINSQC